MFHDQILVVWEFPQQARYNKAKMERKRTHNMSESAYCVFIAVIRLLGELLRSVASTLSSGTKTSAQNDASNNAAQGGALNHRTGRFDDGTDASGWYEKD